MQTDLQKVDLLIQYALLIAGEEDEYRDRYLGPIHLLKYAYLADLAYAVVKQGKTYTGMPWKFHKFGPWSVEVHNRIEPALELINAAKHSFESDYEEKEEWYRWTLRDEHKLHEIESQLPFMVPHAIKRHVHQFGKDTPSLLEHVYKTPPMLEACPGQLLDFSLAMPAEQAQEKPPLTKYEQLSNKKKKRLSIRMRGLGDRYRQQKKEKPKRINPVQKRLYDDEVFVEGVKWLEDIAGPQFSEQKITAHFGDEVWHSKARKGEDVS